MHEVLVLENMWRDRVLATRQRAVSGYLHRWHLPDEILAIIASHTGCNMRGVDARPVGPRTAGRYAVELASVADERAALMAAACSS